MGVILSRQHLRLAVALVTLMVVLAVPRDSATARTAALNPRAAMRIGVTFSQHEAEYRALPWQQAYQNVLEASPALVRLAAYWTEIEPVPGTYDFATIDWLLDQAKDRHQQVVLTVGMKAPRWPEYYLPSWLRKDISVPDGGDISSDPRVRSETLEFLRRVVQHVGDQSVIAAWQVENEALDPSGPRRWSIGADFLAQEVGVVRELDPLDRPVIVNTFVETQPLSQLPRARSALLARARTALQVADVLGLDVYPGRTIDMFGHDVSVRWPAWVWSGALSDLRALATDEGKDAWIVEGQAEPWKVAGKAPPPIWPGAVVDPSSVKRTVSKFQSLGYTTVLLWGSEHWEDARINRQDGWWNAMTQMFTPPSSDAHV